MQSGITRIFIGIPSVNPASGIIRPVQPETDPRFTNNRKWLSSDYMMSRFTHDPNQLLRRLGDGYYEQKLIRNQIMNLTHTGRRLSLNARQDIINTGGQLTGRDGVSLVAGRDIISRSTLTTNADGQYPDRLAGI